jgi:hypothetical protein
MNANNNFDKTSWNSTIAYVPYSDDFEDGNANGWTTNGGTWSVVTDGTQMYKQSTTTGSSFSFAGNSDWTDYTFKAVVNGSSLQFFVNGTLELSATDSSLSSGKVALFTLDASSKFDDVSVEKPATLASDNFEDGDANGWTTNGGTWSVVQDGTYMYKQSAAAGGAFSSVGDWTNFTIQAKVKPLSFTDSTGVVGIAPRFINSNNLYNFRYESGKLQITKKVSGVLTVLAEKAYTINTGTTNLYI